MKRGHRAFSRSADGAVESLASHFSGNRLHSPNDIVVKSDGALYFTGPLYGLAMRDSDPAKELPFNGVFQLFRGQLTLLNDRMTKPNGLASSLDEKYLYVAIADPVDMHWMRFEININGTLRCTTVPKLSTAERTVRQLLFGNRRHVNRSTPRSLPIL